MNKKLSEMVGELEEELRLHITDNVRLRGYVESGFRDELFACGVSLVLGTMFGVLIMCAVFAK